MRQNRTGYFIKEGIGSIFTHGFMSFAAVTVIVACLLIMGSFALLSLNINKILSELESENQILAYVDDSLSEEDARALETKIEAIDNVSDAHFISRDDAMNAFVKQYSKSGLFDNMDSSILRHRFIVTLNDLELTETTRDDLRRIEGIVKVNAHLEISRGFVTARQIVNLVSMALVLILLVVSLFIMSNTIKLTTIDRREEISIMKMVGATNSFIRWPFVVEGMVLGLFGSLLAFLLQWGLYEFIATKLIDSGGLSFISAIPFIDMAIPILAVFLGTGLLVGIGGSLVAIKNYLKV